MVTRRLAPGERIYAVGDVHGQADKLRAIHAAIRADLARSPAANPLLIHLGDYIDRGPDSAGCIALLADGAPLPGVEIVNLMGNHESILLRALDEQSADSVEHWFMNGGIPTLASWGIPSRLPPARWAELIPASHLAFLRGLRISHQEPPYIFVHAGIRPGLPLAEQDAEDLLWIRYEFLEWEGPMLPEAPDSIIVHGHTPSAAPVIRPNRIGIDTNAARGGPVTCVVLGEESPRFLQA